MTRRGFVAPVVLVGILLLLVVIGGAYYLGKLSSSVPLPSPVVTPPSPTSNPAVAWKTYTNNVFGLSFKYPGNIFVYQGSPQPDAQYWSNKVNGGAPLELGEDGVWMNLSVSNLNETNMNYYKNRTTPDKWTVSHDLPKPYAEVSYSYTAVQLRGNVLYKIFVAAFKDDKLAKYRDIFDQILSTFKFTDQTTADSTANWKTYTNNKYKYEIRFPSLWEYNRGPGNLSDAELSNQRDIDTDEPNLPSGNPGTGITIKVNELDGQGNRKNCTSLEDCIEKSFSMWLPKTQEIEKGEAAFLGQPAKTIKYTRVTSLYSQTWKYVFVILNNNFYSFGLSSETKGFDKNLIIFNHVLSTFKFTQ